MYILGITKLEFFIALTLSVLNACMLTIISKKFLQIFQVSNYHIGSYFNWLKNSRGKYLSRIFMLSFLSMGCILVTNVIFNNFKDIKFISYLGLLFYVYYFSIFVNNLHNIPQKKKLTFTKRMIRLITLCFISFLIITFVLMVVCFNFTTIFRFSVIALTPLIVPFIIPICHLILVPMETIIQNHYLSLAQKKLQKCPNLIKIGITGSFAKTSTKDILKTILKEKYKVCFTPNSYNTPMGISKTINKRLNLDDEVFICEMGATYKMDIAKLVKLVDPSITILTGIANQHIMTFKTLDNVIDTKYEIVKYSHDGTICVFNGNNEKAFDLYKKDIEGKQKILIKNDDTNSFCRAENVKFQTNKTTFDLIVDNKNFGTVETSLHGGFVIENILMAVAVCYKLGLTADQIKKGIQKCEQSDHRLFVKELDNNITIIDDSFNANEFGTKRALEYLSLYKNRRKIVMTPGLVDLGNLEKQANYNFGKNISAVADICIIVNLNAREDLKKGLLDSNFNPDNIILCDSLNDAELKFKELLKEGDVLLMCNDLPDNYI